jgi:hypothetical protein
MALTRAELNQHLNKILIKLQDIAASIRVPELGQAANKIKKATSQEFAAVISQMMRTHAQGIQDEIVSDEVNSDVVNILIQIKAYFGANFKADQAARTVLDECLTRAWMSIEEANVAPGARGSASSAASAAANAEGLQDGWYGNIKRQFYSMPGIKAFLDPENHKPLTSTVIRDIQYFITNGGYENQASENTIILTAIIELLVKEVNIYIDLCETFITDAHKENRRSEIQELLANLQDMKYILESQDSGVIEQYAAAHTLYSRIDRASKNIAIKEGAETQKAVAEAEEKLQIQTIPGQFKRGVSEWMGQVPKASISNIFGRYKVEAESLASLIKIFAAVTNSRNISLDTALELNANTSSSRLSESIRRGGMGNRK